MSFSLSEEQELLQETQRLIAEHMDGVPASEAAAIRAGNAARIYGLSAV
jgi:hypothetical protein